MVPDFTHHVFCHSEERVRDDNEEEEETTLGSRSSTGSEGVSDSLGLESTGKEPTGEGECLLEV